MDNYVRCFCFISRYWRMASIILSVCIWIPLNAFCSTREENLFYSDSVSDLLNKLECSDSGAVMNHLNAMEQSFQRIPDPSIESQKFLQAFIDALNARYGLRLTILEACQLIKMNLDILQITPEQKNVLLSSIRLFETGHATLTMTIYEQQPQQDQNYESKYVSADVRLWPYEWIFGHKKSKRKVAKPDTNLCIAKNTDVELPGNCYFGACEAFAGALLCIIPHPLTWSLGSGMIVDGGRRIVDGVIQQSDERRLDPNYVPPKITY